MIRSVRYRITAGKMQDFENLVKSDILPVHKKANVNLIVSQRGVGGNPNDSRVRNGILLADGLRKLGEDPNPARRGAPL